MATSPPTGSIRLHRPSMKGARRLRVFVDAHDQPRSRRATDVLLLVATSIALLILSLSADPAPGFARTFEDFLTGLPDLFNGVWDVLDELPAVFAVAYLLAALGARRWAVARDVAVAAVLAVLAWIVLWRVTGGTWPALIRLTDNEGEFPAFPAARVAVPAAMLVTISPHLVTPARRVSRWTLGLATMSTILLANTSAAGALGGLLTGAGVAAIVHLSFGSSAGRPNLGDVAHAADELGVPIVRLSAAARQQAGNFAVYADAEDGRRLLIKLYGRDAHDAAIVNVAWRTLWYRNASRPAIFGRARQVEHEAFMTLVAERAGVLTDHVETAGRTRTDDAVLVFERVADEFPLSAEGGDDRPDDPLQPAPITVEDLPADIDAQLWSLLAVLRKAGLAHGQIDEPHLLICDGRLGLENFRGATLNSTEQRWLTDVAQVFTTIMLRSGVDAAIASGLAAGRRADVVAMMPYLQPSSLTPWQRRQLRRSDVDLDAVREQIAETIGETAPELVPLRRFSVRAVVSILLPLVAVAAVVTALSGLDGAGFRDAISGTAWWLVVVGLVIAQIPRLAQAIGTMGASPVPLPLGPTYALQLAISYINLAIPTSAARIAVNIRFFQRHGVPPGGAVAAGAIDGFAGFIIQAILVVTIIVFTPESLDLRFGGGSDSGFLLIALFALVGIAAAIVVPAIPRVRRFVVEWVSRALRDGKTVLVGMRSPRRLAMVFGANLASELFFALAITAFVRALNGDVSYVEILFTNISIQLLAGLLPIPGGIGVTEGGIVYGLTAAGMPAETAFAAVIMYRIASFYLPPVWGFFAFRWLERNRLL